MSLPAISGAEPWHGSYRPLLFASSEADGNMPMEPVSIDASSDKISPKILPVKITSNCLGARTSCIAALSTYMCDNATAGYSFCLLYTSDAADDLLCVDLGGRRIIK